MGEGKEQMVEEKAREEQGRWKEGKK